MPGDAPDPADVPWHLLPHDPEGFFGLSGTWDQKDLKRAYNRLIRICKPEHAPAEFQQIRAAYERLDTRIRYGSEIGTPFLIQPDGSSARDPMSHGSDVARSPGPDDAGEPAGRQGQPFPVIPGSAFDPAAALRQELRETSPVAVFERLSAAKTRSPFDYFALAVLSDVVKGASVEHYARSILAGLTEHPSDRGLRGLLYELCRQNVDLPQIPAVLMQMARVIRDDSFYAISEPLWDQLLREVPFAEFRSLLEQCEQSLRDFRIDGRLVFTLHILSRGVFRADDDWIQDKLTFLDSNQDRLSGHASFELDKVTQALECRRELAKSPPPEGLKKRMHAALEQHFSGAEEQRETAMFETQVEIATGIDELLKAFPFNWDSREPSAFLNLWLLVSHELTCRTQSPRVLSPQSGKRTLWFMKSMEALMGRSLPGRIWSLLATLIFSYGAAVLVFLITAIPVGYGFSLLQWDAALSVLLTIGIASATAGFVHHDLLKRRWDKICLQMGIRCYRAVWRRELLHFLGQSRMDGGELLRQADALNREGFGYSSWLLVLLRADEAVPLYTVAQQFLR